MGGKGESGIGNPGMGHAYPKKIRLDNAGKGQTSRSRLKPLYL
jgi:hypothetical protein